jgi:putative ABC transport system ATP-binding protein
MLMQTQAMWKTYGEGAARVYALRDVNLSIDEGEFVAIMGPSGSGKSTLMNILGCLDQPTRGSYRLRSDEVAALSAGRLAEVRNRSIGFVFQAYNLLPRTSALANVQLPLLYAGTPGAESRRRAAEALDSVGLGSRMHHLPSELSGGQQQRVAIARAIVNRPHMILADEPTGNLDSRTSLEIIALFQKLGASGITIVYVTHEPDIAAFASRVIVVRDGEIAQDTRQVAQIAHPDAAADDAPQLVEEYRRPSITQVADGVPS